MVQLDLETLVGRADTIVVGTVKSTKASWTADRKRIVTDAVIEVSEVISGNPVKTVTIRRLGGTVNGIGMRVIGVAVMSVGDRVVAFSEKRAGHRFVVGMSQGLFRVEKAGSKMMVRRALSGLTLAKPDAVGKLRLTHTKATSLDNQTLGELKRRIRSTIALCKTRKNGCQPAAVFK
jgi:hypothetical protein